MHPISIIGFLKNPCMESLLSKLGVDISLMCHRKNRSLKEMETCMMESKNFPPNFCAEYINCASYIQNRVPHYYLDGINPSESWSGHKPYVTHFSIFGSRAWARIPTEKRKDLKPQR